MNLFNRKLLKRFICFCVASAVCLFLILFVCDRVIDYNANGKLYSSTVSIPTYDVGLLLGTTPQTRIGKRQNLFFKYRIDAAESLYKAGKIKKILISGDENSLDGINEVECMKDSLVARGVKDNDIILDGKGFRTFDSVVRAVKIYNKQSFVVISQQFHNERAIYLAEHLNLDVHDVVGYNAKSPTSKWAIITHLREYLARVKALLDLFGGNKLALSFEPTTETNFENRFQNSNYTDRDIVENLIIYTPHYSKIDLVCGTMPSINNTDIVFCAEAAFTGEFLRTFKHSNIAGDHVSGGILYRGYKCIRNTGGFVCYNDSFKFVYGDFTTELQNASKFGGMGFGQEMMIHNSKRVTTTRKDSNKNEFRALCEVKGKLCVIDSNGVSTFGDFIQNLLSYGVTEALYLDMGPGWNYSWWRDDLGNVHEIHDLRIIYTTNWITFY